MLFAYTGTDIILRIVSIGTSYVGQLPSVFSGKVWHMGGTSRKHCFHVEHRWTDIKSIATGTVNISSSCYYG